MKYFYSFFTILLLLLGVTVNAQHLDQILFGNASSELAHGLTSFDMTKSETYVGFQSQTARRFLPYTSNPFSGIYPGIYGGEVTFVMKVDGNSQNYFTGKFSGNEANSGRILLVVDGKELGTRHSENEELFLSNVGQVSPGAFFYRTAPIPRTLTDGKTEITIRLRSSGWLYAYGTSGNYASFQRTLTTPTCGIYSAFMHTDPGFALPSDEVSGATSSYASASSAAGTSISDLRVQAVTNANSYFANILAGADYIATDPNNYFNPIESLAHAYFEPLITSVYHNPTVITKFYKLIDNLVYYNNNKTQIASNCWGGAFGRPGYAVALLWDQLDQNKLDEIVDLGGGTGKTRRSQWIEIFKQSFDFGAGTRKTITNQEMENDASVFGASLALYKLDPVTYVSYPAIGLHMAQESCGLEDFTGKATNLTSTNPQLGNPENSGFGAGYRFVTTKGTTREPGWVSADCYGKIGHHFPHMYEMSKLYLGGNGDMRFLEKAKTNAKAMSLMTYASVGTDGFKDNLTEGYICVRNNYEPGVSYYLGQYSVSLSPSDTLLGYMKQQFQDGRFQVPASADFKQLAAQFIFKTLDALESTTSTIRLPVSPDQPDFFFADEENGIVSIKRGNERLFVNTFFRTTVDNKLVRAHSITDKNERLIEFRPQHTEYQSTGSYVTRSSSLSLSSIGEAPDAPVSGYANQQDAIPVGNGILDLYQVKYGNYFIAMNCSKTMSKTIQFPAELVGQSVLCLNDGQTIVLPATLDITPLSTFVYRLPDSGLTGGQIARAEVTSDKTAISARVSELETFSQQTTTVAKITVVPAEGYFKHETYLKFSRALATAKYMANDNTVSQEQIDAALASLNTAYTELTTDVYHLDPVVVPAVVDYSKRIFTTGNLLFGTDANQGYDLNSTRNGAYTVVPIKASQTGYYKVTILASTTRDASVSPRLNLDYFSSDTNLSSVTVDETKSIMLSTTASWTTFNSYTQYVQLTADEVKLLKLTFLVGTSSATDAGWCGNVRSITYEFLGPYGELQKDISIAQTLYFNYSVSTNAYYQKVTDEDRSKLFAAINQAKSIQTSASTDEISNARSALASAVAIFNAAISPFSMVPGQIDFNIRTSTSGSLSFTTGTFTVPATIGSTKNKAYAVFQFRARKTGNYIPFLLASTNTNATYNPRVNYEVFTTTTAIASSTVDETKSRSLTMKGWAVYDTYTYPTVALQEGQDYYLRVMFLTGTTWCANVKQIGMNYVKDAQTINFPTIPIAHVGDADIDAGAIASSGLPVSLSSSNSAVATIVAGKIHVVGVGESTISATQSGNEIYSAATSVDRVLTVGATVYWNGTAWTPSDPTAADNVVISGTYSGEGFSCCNLTINAGQHFTLASGTLAIGGNFILKCNAANGPATFIDNGTLTVAGKTLVEQFLTGSLNSSVSPNAPNGRFWYVASPVSGATSSSFNALGLNKLWDYSEAAHAYSEIKDNATLLTVGTGYCARMGADTTLAFEGTINKGNQSFNLTRQDDAYEKRGYNLVGNPYPSFIDWDLVSTSNLSASIWRRTFDGTNMVFSTYNSVSKIGSTVNGSTANSFIAPMQAFWVNVDQIAGGTLGLTNAMRSHQAAKLLKSADSRPVMRLTISNSSAKDEAIILFDENASNGLDAYDSEKMSNDNVNIPEIYSVVGGKQAVINGLKSLSTSQDVNLGFRTAVAGSFSLKSSELSNFVEGTSIVLEDKLLNTRQNLLENGEYKFTSEADTTDSRFVLHITKSTTGINDVAESSEISIVKSLGNKITVSLKDLKSYKGQVSVSTVLGQTLMVAELAGQETQFTADYQTGVYLVTVVVDGQRITKKVAITR